MVQCFNEMAKLSKEDWLKTGMQVLHMQGEDGIRIEKLCNSLQVSKGSFYHHFRSTEEYVGELLRFWVKKNTETVISEVETVELAEEKMTRLNEEVIEKDHLTEVRIRAWGIRNKQVQEYVQVVDMIRTGYLKQLHTERGRPDNVADDLAKLEYAVFVGQQHLFRDLALSDKQRLYRLLHHLLMTEL